MRVLVPLVAIPLLLGCPTLEPEPPEFHLEEYHDEAYGYVIQYPDTLELRVHAPEHLELGRQVEGRFESEVLLALVATGPGEARPPSLEEFAHERTRMLCAADGPDFWAECTDVLRPAPFTTGEGLEGHRFFLRHEVGESATGEIIEESERGPFFALDVSQQVPQAWFAVLVVHPPIVKEPAEADTRLVRSVAETVRLVAARATPEVAEQTAFVHDVISNDERALVVDFIDWIEDPEAPGGFRIENPLELLDTLEVAPDVAVRVLAPVPDAAPAPAERLSFDQFADRFQPQVPYLLHFRGAEVVTITQQDGR